jgi:hypothetical protein
VGKKPDNDLQPLRGERNTRSAQVLCDNPYQRKSTALMANTSKLTKEERKKSKRASRKKRKAEKPLKPRDYARGSKKPKVKKLARGQAKR